MTPADRAALRAIGLSGREFAALTGQHPNTVQGWGNGRSGRGIQDTPRWVRLLIQAWTYQPALIEAAREKTTTDENTG